MTDRDHSEDLSEALEERLQTLELKSVYQGHTVDELNAVVTRQQDQIDALISSVKRLHAIVVDGNGSIDGSEEPPPPHY